MLAKHEITQSKAVIKALDSLGKDEKEALAILQKSFGMTEVQAQETFFDPGKWQEWKHLQQKKLDIKDLQMVSKVQDAINAKLDSGSGAQAKELYILLATLRDKVFGANKPGGHSFLVGEKITVNMGWKFTPQPSPNKKLDERILNGEVIEG
ncbi:hypothetical protein HYW46_03090 [Candidatus Daviesbacteria bacterium]|nr:hypothetical protein [Candidatus Daviesbacteria bacterium]